MAATLLTLGRAPAFDRGNVIVRHRKHDWSKRAGFSGHCDDVAFMRRRRRRDMCATQQKTSVQGVYKRRRGWESFARRELLDLERRHSLRSDAVILWLRCAAICWRLSEQNQSEARMRHCSVSGCCLSAPWTLSRPGKVNSGFSMGFKSKRVLRGVLGLFASVSLPQVSKASDLMIWSPVKVAPRTYKTTLGFRLPMAWDVSAGMDLGLGSATSGAILRSSSLATLWGTAIDDHRRFSTVWRREVALRVDTLNSTGTLCLERSRSWTVSENLDMSTSRSLNLNYAGSRNAANSITATQAVTLAIPWTGTSFSAVGNLRDVGNSFSSTVSFQQPLAPNLKFSASFADLETLTPADNLRVDYRVKW